MRYTTIVDISEYASLYRNHNARLVYLHLCLKSGYHDNDRDLLDISVRRLADAVGLSVSATRHSLRVLSEAQLLKREGPLWHVRKFVLEQDISPRVKTEREAKKKSQERQREEAEREQDRRLQADRERRESLQAAGKSDFILYYEQQAEKARKGDADAIRTCKSRRQLYLDACKQFGNDPVEIEPGKVYT